MSDISEGQRELALRAAMLRELERTFRQLDADTVSPEQLQILLGVLSQVAATRTRAQRNRARLANSPHDGDLQSAFDDFADRCAAAADAAEREAGADVIAAAADDVGVEIGRLLSGGGRSATVLEFPTD